MRQLLLISFSLAWFVLSSAQSHPVFGGLFRTGEITLKSFAEKIEQLERSLRVFIPPYATVWWLLPVIRQMIFIHSDTSPCELFSSEHPAVSFLIIANRLHFQQVNGLIFKDLVTTDAHLMVKYKDLKEAKKKSDSELIELRDDEEA